MFWNVAGILNKDLQFWKFIEEMDIVGMAETWMEEGKWEGLKEKLPQDF